jgi:hypothetical protein
MRVATLRYNTREREVVPFRSRSMRRVSAPKRHDVQRFPFKLRRKSEPVLTLLVY